MSDVNILYKALHDNCIPVPNNDFNALGICRWGEKYRYWAIDLDCDGFAFGDWTIPNDKHFVFDNSIRHQITPDQRKILEKSIKERFTQEQKRIVEQQNRQSVYAQAMCVGSYGEIVKHPYLERKQIPCPPDVTYNREQNALFIPVSDINGKIWGFQTIYADGQKRFLKGARKKGCMYCFGNIASANTLFVCEGFATGASVYLATHNVTIAAFDAGNIESVVAEITNLYPQKQIIIAADNDWEKSTNTGLETAKRVATKYHIRAISPTNLTKGMSDWNDIACKYGIKEITNQFEKGEIL